MTDRSIIQLAQTILAISKDDWVSWKKVAKRQEGSEQYADMLSGIADLPEAKQYFIQARNGKVVKLTQEGIILAQDTQKQPRALALPQQVADTVKQYASRLAPMHFPISKVFSIGKARRKHVYALEVEVGDALIPKESPITIRLRKEGTRINGRIVGQSESKNLIYVSLESTIASFQLPADLYIDRAFLLSQLAESIKKMEEVPLLGSILFKGMEPPNWERIAHSDSKAVADDLFGLSTPWSKFLWGPPGAGKTFGLARFMAQLVERFPNEKILLLAPSNIAVDVALLQLIDALKNKGMEHLIEGRQIYRYGYPRKTEILTNPALLGSKELQEKSKQISNLSKQIQKLSDSDSRNEEQLALLRAELLDLQEQLKDIDEEHILSAKVVATTTTLAYMQSSPVFMTTWDTVLVDEVTMVPPSVCFFLSSLSRKRLLFAGDPRQLGPVYEEHQGHTDETRRWIGSDVFEFAGLSIGNGENRQIIISDNRLVRITSQRRCTTDIWSTIKHLYPGVIKNVNEKKLIPFLQLKPKAGFGIAILNTSKHKYPQNVTCEKSSKSWRNKKSADLSVHVAKILLQTLQASRRSGTISIITPYRAQHKLISQLLKEQELHQDIEVGTIHQFQGSEADVVIFDIVDDRGRKSLGQLLRGDAGVRLVNVAFSRARGKLIILADIAWFRSTVKRDNNPILWDVIAR